MCIGDGESQLSGEHAPVVSQMLYNQQQCHGGFLLLNVQYFKSSPLAATQMDVDGGCYQVLITMHDMFYRFSWYKICVAFGLSNDSIIDQINSDQCQCGAQGGLMSVQSR